MAQTAEFQPLDYTRYDFKDPETYKVRTARGLSREIVEQISALKEEPAWMLDYRLRAYEHFVERPMPDWGPDLDCIDFDAYTYYANPLAEGETKRRWEDLPADIRNTFDKLGIPKAEREFFGGVGAQYDSGTVYHRIRDDLKAKGVVFTDTDTAVREYPDIVRKYFGKIVPYNDNKFSALNSAVWSGGSFVYVPPGVDVGIPLQAYFRINAKAVGQFERTLIIADKGAKIHYIEGCLPKGEEVLVGDELTPIESIETGRAVLNSDGEATTVEKTMVRPYDGDMVHITPVSKSNAFQLTPEHPVLCVRREKVAVSRRAKGLPDVDPSKLAAATPEFVPAGELKPGDFVHYPVNRTENDDPELGTAAMNVLGYYLAEGCTQMINGCEAVTFTFHIDEREFVDRLVEGIRELTGKTAWTNPQPKKHAIVVGVYSRALFDLCETHCGRLAGSKRLSQTMMELPPAKQQLLLKAYYEGDGHVYRRGGTVHRVMTISRQLAFQVQELQARQGVFATILERAPFKETMKDGREISHHTLYTIYHQVGKRAHAVHRVKGSFLVPIRKIHRTPYRGNVYNFHVAGKNNTYLVKGFSVHNCTAPIYSTDSLHTAVVEVMAEPYAKVRYTTVQNWSKNVYNLVTKRAVAMESALVEWVDGNMGSKITMKYPSVYLKGRGARADILSVAFASAGQVIDSGAKCVHSAPDTSSKIVSKSIAIRGGRTSYRGLLHVAKGATGVKAAVRCDALLPDEDSRSDTYPYNEIHEEDATITHEAVVGKIGEEQIFYLMSRGLSESDAIHLILMGFLAEFAKELPMDYALELNRLIQLEMTGAVG
ncbi:MAG: SufD family Fe-S cluster assembly protein [Thermoplasmata archaeon]|nr:SufD family Fe-S cluster assembly protein [Thermoplasmata archaeon]MCI4341500.1 SufD family Fe-S cluster assembly protein [Thermoplasmata archaeon]